MHLFIGFNGDLMEIHGIEWDSIEFNGICSIEFSGLMGFNGILKYCIMAFTGDWGLNDQMWLNQGCSNLL